MTHIKDKLIDRSKETFCSTQDVPMLLEAARYIDNLETQLSKYAEYKALFEAAESFINESPCHPLLLQREAWQHYQSLLGKHKYNKGNY